MNNAILEALLLFLPAGIANMAPPIANKIPRLNRWNTTMDFGKSYRGVRIFGDHKTWRGFTSAVVCGTITGALLYTTVFTEESAIRFILLCASMSAGALIGDAIKSFFKRRVNVKPGSAWFPFDQLDYIIGALLFMMPFGVLSWSGVTAIFGVYFVGHIVITYISYLLGFKDAPI